MEHDHIFTMHSGFHELLVLQYQLCCVAIQGVKLFGRDDVGAMTVDDETVEDILIRLINKDRLQILFPVTFHQFIFQPTK